MGEGVLLDHPAQVAAFESGLKDQHVVLFSLGDVEGQHVELEGRGLDFFREGGRIFAVVDDCVDVVLGEDDGFDLPAQGLLQDVVLGEVHCLVGVVGGVQLGLRGQEHIVRDTEWAAEYLLKGNSSLGDLYVVWRTFCRVFCLCRRTLPRSDASPYRFKSVIDYRLLEGLPRWG